MQHELTARLPGTGNDGHDYVVHEFTELVPTPTYGNPRASKYGMKAYRLESGEACSRQALAVFRVMKTGVVITILDARN